MIKKITEKKKKMIDYSDPKYHMGRGLVTEAQRATIFRFFLRDELASDAAEEADVNYKVALRLYRLWREAIYRSTAAMPRFMGEIEMDQKMFGGRGLKRMRTLLTRYKKYLPYAEYQKKAKEIRAEHKTKVFGILQRDTQQVYIKIIKREDKRTLEPIIFNVVEAKKSVIFTDKWRGFAGLKLHGYKHHSINHSEEYVDKKGNHANTIESFWSHAQRRLAKFNGIHHTVIRLHLKECEFRWNHRRDLAAALTALLV